MNRLSTMRPGDTDFTATPIASSIDSVEPSAIVTS
jgi:hypothetical protein